MVGSAFVTRKILSLGDISAYTGWYAKSYADQQIEAAIISKNAQTTLYGTGLVVRTDALGVSVDPVANGDIIGNPAGEAYLVSNLQANWWFDTFMYYTYDLTKIPSGFWTQSTEYNSIDPRYRTKLWLEHPTYGIDLDQLENYTTASVIVQFDEPEYDAERIFGPNGKDVDGVYSIATPQTEGIPDWNGFIFAYHEDVPIKVFGVNKTGISGTILAYELEQELRRIAETQPMDKFRTLKRISAKDVWLGSYKLHQIECLLSYEREAETAHTSGFTLSHSHGYITDCESLTDVYGAWTEQPAQANCTFTLDPRGFFNFATTNTSGTYYYMYPDEAGANNLTISQSLYPKIRVRYKCSNLNQNPSVKLVFSDASTQTISLDDSTTLVWATADITASKTVDHIRLQMSPTATGSVYWDCVEIYKGDFAIPNVRYGLTEDSIESKDVVMGIPVMGGDVTNGLGSGLREMTFNCDATKGTWTRTLPNDQVVGEFLWDIMYNNRNEPFQVLTTPTAQFKVRVVRINEPKMASADQLDWRFIFTLREYRDSDRNCAHETYRTAWGLNEA